MQKEGLILMDSVSEDISNDCLLNYIASKKNNTLETFIHAFVRRTIDQSLLQLIAELLMMLLGDAPISSVVPFRYHCHLLDMCARVKTGQDITPGLKEMQKYGMHLSNTLRISINNNFTYECATFYEYLVSEVSAIYSEDVHDQTNGGIIHPYDPEGGIAYYFH